MKRIAILFAFGVLLLIQPLHANGGGYFRGGVENTGDIAGFEPKATENIRILDENLTIRLGPKEAEVEVRYLMRNVTDKKVKVRFGFPVEESADRNLMGEPDRDKAPDPKRLAYCKNYQITAAGKAVKATWQGELRESKEPPFKGVAGWLISEITFAANEEKPVMIRFQSEYPLEEWGVSDDGSSSAALFRYRLSSAACWAGTIGMGKIVVEPHGIDPADIRILKPVNRFQKQGVRWVWEFENLEPTLADDLEIEARPEEFVYGGRTTSGEFFDHESPPHLLTHIVKRGEKWSMLHSNYEVKASSTLPNDGDIRYSPENIREHWEGNAWSEGEPGPGTGAWLELTPAVAKPLLGIRMKPGYQKEGLFKANARPKKVRVELNGEHRFDADIADVEEEITIPVTGYSKAVKKIRLTFTEVYPGTRFEDLCVTGVRLHARLDKKPNVQPAR
jgi:hypothetical protein